MARYRRNIRSIKEVVQDYFSDYLVSSDTVRLISTEQWVDIVGKKVAEHSRPLYIENGVLLVETRHSAWGHFILLKSNSIIAALSKIDKNLSVKSIKLKLTRRTTT